MIRRLLIAVVASLVVASFAWAQGPNDAGVVAVWLQSSDRAFVAKDLDKLESFYHPDVTIFEGGSVNNGWIEYRDHHIGPELKGSKTFNSNIATSRCMCSTADVSRA